MVLFLGLAPFARCDDPVWQELKQKHFIVYYVGNRAFAEKVGRTAERHYDKIGRDLGFTRHGDFWLWDRRARIYIYGSRAEFRRGAGAPDWAAGKADPGKRLIATWQGSAAFLDSVLPHEMTHLIFMEFIGFKNNIPLWLNEGVAQWEDVLRREGTVRLARQLRAHGSLTPLVRLMTQDVRTIGDTAQAAAFYAQSVSLVGFMIECYGSSRFRTFCGHLRDGKSVDDALRFTYSSEIRNIEMLETEWHEYLEELK